MVTESFVSEESDSAGSDGVISDGNWFIVQTYSGHEANVKQHIQQAIQTLDIGDRIFDVFIPLTLLQLHAPLPSAQEFVDGLRPQILLSRDADKPPRLHGPPLCQ